MFQKSFWKEMTIPSFLLFWLYRFFVGKYYLLSYRVEYFYQLMIDGLRVDAFHRRVDGKQQLVQCLLPLDIIYHGQ
jgi:hypothetical protein